MSRHTTPRTAVAFGLQLGWIGLVAAALTACSSTPGPNDATDSGTTSGGSSTAATSTAASTSKPGPDAANDPAMHVEGKRAPDFTLDTIDGEQVSLSDFANKKVVIIDFWETTCAPCLKEMPHLVKLYEKYKDRGLMVLAISLDGPDGLADVKSVAHDKGMEVFPVLLDPQTSVYAKFTPKNDRPYTVVVGKNGNIADEHGSYVPGDEKKLEELVAKLIP